MKTTIEIINEAFQSLQIPGVMRTDQDSETHKVTAYVIPSGEVNIIRIDIKPLKKK